MAVIVGLLVLTVLTAACGGDDGTVESRSATSGDGAGGGGDEPRSSDDPSTGTGLVTGVSGTVRSAGGAPVTGALVVPVSADQPPQAVPEMAVMTDASGGYVWSLRPGAYDVTVTAEGHEPATRHVVVSDGQTAPLDFELSPAD